MKLYYGLILKNWDNTREFKIVSSNEVIAKQKVIKIKWLDTNKRGDTTYKAIINNIVGKPRKLNHDEFCKRVSKINPNVEILDEYKGSNNKLKCRCKIHNVIYYTLPSNLLRGSGCSKCKDDKLSKLFSKSHEEFIIEMKNINPQIEILGEYIKSDVKILCRCKIHNITWYAIPNNLLKGQGCKECGHEKTSGENSYLYNPNLTDEEREKSRNLPEIATWRKEVYERDNYTCQCCGDNKGGNLVAHHKNGYNWDKEHRTDVNNGVTLCEDCHKEFHDIYGYGNNTEEQYIEFLNNKHLRDVV